MAGKKRKQAATEVRRGTRLHLEVAEEQGNNQEHQETQSSNVRNAQNQAQIPPEMQAFTNQIKTQMAEMKNLVAGLNAGNAAAPANQNNEGENPTQDNATETPNPSNLNVGGGNPLKRNTQEASAT